MTQQNVDPALPVNPATVAPINPINGGQIAGDQMAGLAKLAVVDALAQVRQQGAMTAATVEQLAAAALDKAATDPEAAKQWLAIAEQVEATLGNDAGRLARVAYAQARIHVHQGELTMAEAVLRQAQLYWQQAGDSSGHSRSLLGLTQILAMQGRYAEAETIARMAVTQATTAEPSDSTRNDRTSNAPEATFALLMRRVAAHHNLATLLLYQERHADALGEYEQIRHWLPTEIATGATPTALVVDEEQRAELLSKVAHSDLNRATALTFLDQPPAAEVALQQAITLFQQIGDSINLGRSRTNLGRLYLRTGRYGAALTSFEAAFRDLLGPTTTMADATVEQLRQADELLLEYAMACLVINLLPEAGQALTRTESLFRTATQPYELGQTRYTQGLLFLRTQQWKLAQSALEEAATLFAALQNRFWLNRTRLAQAALAHMQQQVSQARQLLDLLLTENSPSGSQPMNQADGLHWDIGSEVEAHLLHLRLDIEEGKLDSARQQATLIETLLSGPNPAENRAIFWPHLQVRLHHMLGKLAHAAGDYQTARQHLKRAIEQLEGQRMTLVVEELRSAFVDDKSELYADLVQSLFALAPDDTATVAEAFNVVEQSRSRVLLERLLAALDESTIATPDTPAATGEEAGATVVHDGEQQRRAELREQLHWLYNQLMGEGGSRRLNPVITHQLQQTEAALQQIEWRLSPLLAQAQAVDLAAFQAVLAPDQQAVVYAEINQEILAFLVDRTSVQVYRNLTTVGLLQRAIDEFRFQMGRVEVDPAYVARHSHRLESGLRDALHQIYQLLLAPMARALYAPRLLFVPFGQIHRLPLHALWDGERYLVERAECSYAPSASLAVFRRERAEGRPFHSWAGFAIADPAIPAARREVESVTQHFARATTYMDAEANRKNLWLAAAETDILHLATHGLFRPDNPFFSALKLTDGWVDVRELYRLPLTARLVVLSACESGVGEIAGGDEVVGLARGFLGAGAGELIASLWNVHDASAAGFMDYFYRHLLAGQPAGVEQIRPAAALCAAQRNAITEHQHPYYWAPFFVIGG